MEERNRPKRAFGLGVQDKPVSIALLFPPVFMAVYLLHWTLLRLPYFWDEGGYYIPAAWDFFRLGTLIPESTLKNAHPPLPSILMAAWWKLSGFHVSSTRLLICLVASFALLGAFRVARVLAGEAVAYTVLVLTAIYPVWFAQSTLAHADIFAAAFTMWGLSFYFDRPRWAIASTDGADPSRDGNRVVSNAISCGALFGLAALSKETAIVTPAALFCYEGFFWFASNRLQGGTHVRKSGHGAPGPAHFRGSARVGNTRGLKARLFGKPRTGDGAPGSAQGFERERMAYLIALAFPMLPLAMWFGYHRAKTGFMFGNPEYLRYNATANLSAVRILLSLWHRLIHLTVHMNLFVPVVLTMAVLLPWHDRTKAVRGPALARGASLGIGVVVVTHWVAFSVLGGALLTRYLLPAYPLLLLVCVTVWRERVRAWWVIAVLSLAGFAIGCEVNPPYPFAPEDNLSYRDMIVLHQQAIRVLQQRYPAATVLTAWPVAADLQRPELGYLRTPMRTTEVGNFTREEVAKAAEEPGNFDAALVFSTKYNPPPGGLNLAEMHGSSDAQYFDAHRDLLPDEIARALGGRIVWQGERKGEWAAVLHFPRAYAARLKLPRR